MTDTGGAARLCPHPSPRDCTFDRHGDPSER